MSRLTIYERINNVDFLRVSLQAALFVVPQMSQAVEAIFML